MNTIYTQIYTSPVGELIIGSFDNELCLCDWRYRKMRGAIDQRIQKDLNAEYKEGESYIIENTIQQLSEYFSKERTQFDIPLKLVGTEFQKQVWKELIKIPFGETSSYLNLSQKLGNDKAIRAVASANGANAISIIVPCHRIIGSDGKLVGYAGGITAKKKLLELEGSIHQNKQLSLFES
jgi:methylated-DNA-[protein]-cysteine S-methyltransferase